MKNALILLAGGTGKRFDFAEIIGKVDDKVIFNKNGEKLVELDIGKTRKEWTNPIWERLA